MRHVIALRCTTFQMRHPPSSSPSFSLHRIAAAMSAPSPFRGGHRARARGRGRRSYSDRPLATSSAATSTVVSGDSHFESVRDANSGFQHRHNNINNKNNNNNSNSNSNSNNQNFNYRYNNNSNRNNQNFNYRYNNGNSGGSDSYNNGGGFKFQPQLQSYRPRPPPFIRRHDQPQQARPMNADYRIWEYAKHPPPPHSERFVVLSYNILADYLANTHRHLYFHIPHRFMSWSWRKGNILFELGLWSPDIMCFQEVDRFYELEEDLRLRGYSGIWKMRTGEPIDGCAIFWRTSRFKLVYEECIEFKKLGMRDNVAQICVLELIQSHTSKSSSECTGGPNRVVICNIHVLYNPGRGEMKLGQVRVLLERAQSASKKWDDAPVVLCGDFNCTPKSPLYNYLSEQKLDISELERDKVSGQASAVLRSRTPPRQYNHARRQSTGNITSPTLVQNNSVEGKHNASPENQNASESISEDLPIENSLCQPPLDESLLDVSDRVCNESSMKSQEVTNKTIHNVEDFATKNGGSAVSVSTDSSKGEGQSCHSDKSTFEIKSAESYSQFTSETELDSELTSSVSSTLNFGLLSEEHALKPILTSDDISLNCSTDSLFPSTDDSDKEIVEEYSRDNCNSNNSQSESSYSTTSGSFEVRINAKTKPGPTSVCETSDPNTSLTLENDIDGKLDALSVHDFDASVQDNEDLSENAEKVMSESHNDGNAFPTILGDTTLEDPSSTPKSETVSVEKPLYDPSLWTPMEIATAIGNANSTVLEHSLNLTSTYSEVEDRTGTRDSNGEPLVTSYNSCFMGTVDYIWRSEGLHTVKVLAPISKDAMQPTGGFPTKKWGSDHIALVSELAFTK